MEATKRLFGYCGLEVQNGCLKIREFVPINRMVQCAKLEVHGSNRFRIITKEGGESHKLDLDPSTLHKRTCMDMNFG